MKEKKSSTAWLAAVLLLLIALASAYVAGYFLRGKFVRYDGDESLIIVRYYPTQWEASMYEPAARIEEAIRGGELVSVQSRVVPSTGYFLQDVE